MANYLLLRNNKESGPYSLEQLASLGLKAYDLVWVEGKSAAWRYPGELAELKAFAPPVEEQPFDRFYKKTAAEQIEQVIAQRKESYQQEVVNHTIPNKTQEFSTSTSGAFANGQVNEEPVQQKPQHETVPASSRKGVFVTLPGQQTQSSVKTKPVVAKQPVTPAQPLPINEQTNTIQKTEAAKQSSLNDHYTDSTYAQYAGYMPADKNAQTVSITENPAAAKTKFAQPLDDIKEMYVKTLQDRKQKIARKTFWLKNLKIAAALLSLVAIGAVLGFLIKDRSASKQIITAEKTVAQASVPAETTEDTALAMINPPSAPSNNEQVNSEEKIDPVTEPSSPAEDKKRGRIVTSDVDERPSSEKNNLRGQEVIKAPESKTNTSGIIDQKPNAEYYPGANTNSSGERIKQTRAANDNLSFEEPVDKSVAVKKTASPLASKVDVSTNNYQRVAFGGIRNLELTVTNDSKYQLDNVLVELQYIRPNETALKTENIVFRSIAPHASITQRVADTNRGIRVDYKIIHIESRQLTDEVAKSN